MTLDEFAEKHAAAMQRQVDFALASRLRFIQGESIGPVIDAYYRPIAERIGVVEPDAGTGAAEGGDGPPDAAPESPARY